MRKYIFTTIIIIIQIPTFGQKWYFEGIYNECKYKYRYCFSFQNEDDTNSIELLYTPIKETSRKITGVIFNRYNEKLPYAHVQILDSNQNVVSNITPNSNGDFFIDTIMDNFELKITYIGYDKFSIMVNLKQNEDLYLKIKLGMDKELRIYEIHSKRQLKTEEIIKIIECVKNSRDQEIYDFYKTCVDSKIFELRIQI